MDNNEKIIKTPFLERVRGFDLMQRQIRWQMQWKNNDLYYEKGDTNAAG
jgi:hypothetical protein